MTNVASRARPTAAWKVDVLAIVLVLIVVAACFVVVWQRRHGARTRRPY